MLHNYLIHEKLLKFFFEIFSKFFSNCHFYIHIRLKNLEFSKKAKI